MTDIREGLEKWHRGRGKQILDGFDLKRAAQRCGLSPEDFRSELKKLGYIKTKNRHGLAVWRPPSAR